MPDIHVPKLDAHGGGKHSILKVAVEDKSANPAFLDRTAWDLALATQSLTYIDADLAYALSAIYNVQSAVGGEAEGFMQGMFSRPPSQDLTAYFAALQAYFGDMTFF